MRWVSVPILFVVLLIGATVYFLDHGYTYNTTAYDLPRAIPYNGSPECDALQKQKETIEAPIQQQMEPIANELIHGSLPNQRGQELYDKYDALRSQIQEIEKQYSCTHIGN
jgi:hypothetical protein